MQRVQTLTRLVTPLTVIDRRCTFGANDRFVRRFEKLTLWPKVRTFPQTSHLPATGGLPFHSALASIPSLAGSAEPPEVDRAYLTAVGGGWTV